MISFALTLPILAMLATPVAGPVGERFEQAVEVYQCDFGPSWDQNFDLWPDRWTRRRGPGFPHYVNVDLDQQGPPGGGRSVRVQLNGGGAALYSPALPLSALHRCVVEAYVQVRGLKHDRAFLSLGFQDAQKQTLATVFSPKLSGSHGWTRLRLGPAASPDANATHVVVGLHVEPHDASRQDIRGEAWFGGIWVGRLPRLELACGNPLRLFLTSDSVEIACRGSGFDCPRLQLLLELEDIDGRVLAKKEEVFTENRSQNHTALTPGPSPADRNSVRQARGGEIGSKNLPDEKQSKVPADETPPPPNGLVFNTAWKPSLPGPGLYRIKASARAGAAPALRSETRLAVVDAGLAAAGGLSASGSQFGWSLPQNVLAGKPPAGSSPDAASATDRLVRVLKQAGLRRVKCPVWFAPTEMDRQLEPFCTLVQRLNQQGIEVVGVLADPPADVRDRLPPDSPSHAADVFSTPADAWYPTLEMILTRLATQIGYWQLGQDRDTSFVGYPNLLGKMRQIDAALAPLGEVKNLGCGWGWMNQLPPTPGDEPPWRFLSFAGRPPLTVEELAAYLDATVATKFQRWVALETLDGQYDLPARAADLMGRMLAAKVHKADAVFLADSFDPQRGVMDDDGAVGELFLPWRTMALFLGGARHLGSIALPQQSRNEIFARGDDAVMVVWSDKPTQETLYLGQKVRQFDAWGRELMVKDADGQQTIQSGPLPSFVTGLNQAVAQWRMEFAFGRQRIPCHLGVPLENSFAWKNHFPQKVSGRVQLVVPEQWMLSPRQAQFQLGPGEELKQPLAITLPGLATAGQHPVRADFEVQAEQPYRFSVYQHIEVGMGDVSLEIRTQLNPQGTLDVQQRLINRTGQKVSFRCQLFAPERPRQQTDVVDLPAGQASHVYRVPGGEEMLGRALLVRAEEIRGPRVLNYRITAQR